MSFLSLVHPRGLFVKLVAVFLLISVPVIGVGMFIDVHFSSARFERDVRAMLAGLHEPSAAAIDPADPRACRARADALFWRTVQAGASQVSDFDLILADFHAGRLHVAIADGGGIRCGSSPAPTAALAAALAHATAAENFERTGDDWTLVRRLDLPGNAGAYAWIGVHYLRNWPEPTTTAYDLWRTLTFVGALGAGIAGAMVWLVVHRVRRATRVAGRWAAGDLAARIDDRSRDEFSALAVHFNRMADALAQGMERDRAASISAERHRMARDLHDTAKQRGFVLGLKLTELAHHARAHPELLPAIGDARVLVDHLQQDLAKAVSEQSHSLAVPAWNPREALIHGIDDLLKGSGMAWSVELPAALEEILQRHAALAHELLLITQEAVANALRHSGGTQVRIEATLRPSVRWTIADDGHGFPRGHARRSKGMGLANMRWRAQALPRGQLAVASNADGTRITVSFQWPGQA